MQTLLQDLRYGLRMLLKKPSFTLIAVITLALGIGANTAIFSVVNAVLFSSLPYPAPEQLTMVWVDNPRKDVHEGLTSYANFEDWKTQNHIFESMAAFTSSSISLTGTGEPERLRGAMVSPNFFSLLRVSPIVGRGFLPEEQELGRNQVVILSHGLWQRRFGADPRTKTL